MRVYVISALLAFSVCLPQPGWAQNGAAVQIIDNCGSYLEPVHTHAKSVRERQPWAAFDAQSAPPTFDQASQQLDQYIEYARNAGAGRMELQDSADLFSKPIADLTQRLEAQDVRTLAQGDRYLQALYTQLRANIASVSKDIAGGHFPYVGSLECLNNIRVFISLLGKPTPKRISQAADLSWFPPSFDAKLSRAEDTRYIKSLLADPQSYYQEFRKRLLEQGPNAPTPEFRSSVFNLTHNLMDNSILDAGRAAPLLNCASSRCDALEKS